MPTIRELRDELEGAVSVTTIFNKAEKITGQKDRSLDRELRQRVYDEIKKMILGDKKYCVPLDEMKKIASSNTINFLTKVGKIKGQYHKNKRYFTEKEKAILIDHINLANVYPLTVKDIVEKGINKETIYRALEVDMIESKIIKGRRHFKPEALEVLKGLKKASLKDGE